MTTKITGQITPSNAPIGTIWRNPENGKIYYKSEHNRWINADQDDYVVDIIDEVDTNIEAYDRAMSIL